MNLFLFNQKIFHIKQHNPNGKRIFQPRYISWSDLKRGIAALTHIIINNIKYTFKNKKVVPYHNPKPRIVHTHNH